MSIPSVFARRVLGAVSFVLLLGSTARAQDFGPPALLSDAVANSDIGNDLEPRIASDGNGHWVAIWYSSQNLEGDNGVDGDLFVSRSSDNGATWTAPATLNSNAATDLGSDFLAHLVTDGTGTWIAVWTGLDETNFDYDILSTRSTDNGATWSAVQVLNSNAAADSMPDQSPNIAGDGAGNWVVTWASLDNVGGSGSDFDILYSYSVDDGLTWASASPLSANATTDSGFDGSPTVASDMMGNWIVAWESNDSLGATIGTDMDVLFSVSADMTTWTTAAPVAGNATTDTGDDYAAHISNDYDGNWIVVWQTFDTLGGTIGGDGDILFARSTNAGASWSAVAPLNTNAATDSGGDSTPRVASDGTGNWVVVWRSDDTLGGTITSDLDIFVAHSTNDGVTWTAPAALNSNAVSDAAYDLGPDIATDGAGNWITVWGSEDSLGTFGSDYDILYARSSNIGASWTVATALHSNALEDAGHDFSPSTAGDGSGKWVAVWHSLDSLGGTISGDHDVLVTRSSDNGATWAALAALNSNAAADSGADTEAVVVTDGDGVWIAAWQSDDTLGGTIGVDQDILFARSTDDGATWSGVSALNTNAASDSGNDVHPQLATDGAGKWVAVWQTDDDLGGTIGTDGDILVSRSADNGVTWSAPEALNTSATSDSAGDFEPHVASDRNGHWVTVWHSIDPDPDIRVARSSDNGATWTAPAYLNSNAPFESDEDSAARVASDGNGQWVAVWKSKDSLSGTIGNDEDILVARSNDNGASWTAQAALGTNAATESGHDRDPRIDSDGNGNWIATWTSYDDLGGTIDVDADILMSLSVDGGSSWTAPAPLNQNAAGDAGHDEDSSIASNRAGRWIAVWQSDDGLGGTASYGTKDIFVSVGRLCGDTFTIDVEECDSGLGVAGDCCTDTCEFEPVDTPCDDDDDICTEDVCVALGICGREEPLDAGSCFVAPRGKLQISRYDDASKNKLAWQWSRGDAFEQTDLGDPLTTTSYTLCVYDTSAAASLLGSSLEVVPNSALWTSKDPKGFSYKDKNVTGAADGVTQIQIKPGGAAKTKIKLAAKGVYLELPDPAGDAFFEQDPRVVVQLRSSIGGCWTNEFAVADTPTNSAGAFKAQTK